MSAIPDFDVVSEMPYRSGRIGQYRHFGSFVRLGIALTGLPRWQLESLHSASIDVATLAGILCALHRGSALL
ncbi:MAG: hypothetical protein R3F58_03250 [Steroidobacteraceae bacterium]